MVDAKRTLDEEFKKHLDSEDLLLRRKVFLMQSEINRLSRLLHESIATTDFVRPALILTVILHRKLVNLMITIMKLIAKVWVRMMRSGNEK